MGVCGIMGIKKWITTKRHGFAGRNQGVKAVESRILKDKFVRLSTKIRKKKPGNHDKVQEKMCPRKENSWNSYD